MASHVVNDFVHGINYGLRRLFKDAVIAVVDNNLFSTRRKPGESRLSVI